MATIKINDYEFNSYATVEEANKYFSARFGSSWHEIDEVEKAQLLVSATREIEKLKFQGIKLDPEQELKFPRVICCYLVELTNKNLVSCCCEIAYAIYNMNLITGDIITPNADKIQSMSVGNTSITFKEGATVDCDNCLAVARQIAEKFLGDWLAGNVRVYL